MDKEFSSALHKAIDAFGKDIVKEKRFVDIVSDYYPAMTVDHPAWKKVLTAIIVEGFGNDVLICNNSVDARICVDKYTALVAKKNGFDKKLVEGILLELCSALGISTIIPPASPNRPVNNPSPKKKTSSKPIPVPPSNNGKGKNKPSSGNNGKATNNPNPASKRGRIIVKIFLSLLIAIIGMFASTYAYYLYCNEKWWMLFTLILIAAIQGLCIGLNFNKCYPSIRDWSKNQKDDHYFLWYRGAICSFCLFMVLNAIIPIIIFFAQLSDIDLEYMDSKYVTVITFFLAIIMIGCYLVAGIEPSNNLKLFRNNKTFLKGFVISTIIILFTYSIPFDIYGLSIYKYNNYNNSIDQRIKENAEIRKSNNNKNVDLSFKGISLNDSFEKVYQLLNNDSTWLHLSSFDSFDDDDDYSRQSQIPTIASTRSLNVATLPDDDTDYMPDAEVVDTAAANNSAYNEPYDRQLSNTNSKVYLYKYGGISGTEFSDSVFTGYALRVGTKLDGSKIRVDFFFIDDKLGAIKIEAEPYSSNIDFQKLYNTKYGTYEKSVPEKIDSLSWGPSFSEIFFSFGTKTPFYYDFDLVYSCLWNFQNGNIIVDYKEVLYVSKFFIAYYTKQKGWIGQKKREYKIQEEKSQRKAEADARLMEEKQKKEEENEKKKEHKKALNDI